jgi:hypothetical protein
MCFCKRSGHKRKEKEEKKRKEKKIIKEGTKE